MHINPTTGVMIRDLGFSFIFVYIKKWKWATLNVCSKAATRKKIERKRERETCKRMEIEKQGMNWRPWEKKELKSETISSSGRCSALSRPNTAFDSSNPSVALFFIFELLPNSYLTHTGQRRDSDTKRRRNKNFSVLLFFYFICYFICVVQIKGRKKSYCLCTV